LRLLKLKTAENRFKKKIPQEKDSPRQALQFILTYVKRHLWSVLFGIALLVAVDLIQILIPRIIQRIIDHLGEADFSQSLLIKNTLVILLFAVGMVVIRFFWRVFIVGTSRRIEKEVREDMFSHLQSLGFSYFNRTQTGSLMALMINDVNAIRMATGPSFIALTDALFMGTMALFFMFSINVRLAFFTVLPMPLILFMMARYGPLIQARFRAVQESFAGISTQAQEVFSGIRVVKGFVQENKEQERFGKQCKDYVDKNMELIRIWGFFFPAITLFANLSLAILFLVGGKFVILNRLSFGEFVSFNMYLNLLVWPVIATGWVFNLLQRGLASSRRILELMDTLPDVTEPPEVNREITSIKGEIIIKNLNFTYPDSERRVLQEVTMEIPVGTSMGIMGRPGAGKSTLITLLFRLFPIDKGALFIDGHEINTIPLKVLRGRIGYVPQVPFLFSDTIKNNITFGRGEEEVDFAEVERVTRAACIFEEIISFKHGFNTVIGERGITLSGGQKQRISIARALILNPDVLVMDDALSNVDASTERIILKNIFNLMKGKTMMIVSHRVSTVRECDKILILEKGRILEQGTPRELLGTGGYYQKLFEFQLMAKDYEDISERLN